ncbi:MAG: 1,4-dihydroxy-2-naphthoate polyprenyltransferase [Actinomycetota bacterium]
MHAPVPAPQTPDSSRFAAQVHVWWVGARPKTLGAALSPVVVGTAVASLDGPIRWVRALAALIVALALQVGVNYANDYSDGVRGTDAERRGPIRLVASGLASPAAVRRSALGAFSVAAVIGATLSFVVDARLLLVGLLAIVAAATYAGGPKPYGYIGLGEVMVLVFFGFVATVGSVYVQHEQVPGIALWAAIAVGLPACGILLTNNLRDIDTDRAAGKRTLATRVGPVWARRLYTATIVGAFIAVGACVVVAPTSSLAFGAIALAVEPLRIVRTRRDPPALVAALVGTARLQLVLAVLLATGLWIG